jgi:hypothetical protein
MLMALGALALLSFLVLRVNSGQLTSQDNMQNTKYGLLAVSLATSVIEDANRRAFDNKSIDNGLTSTTQLTSVGSLGPESGETYDTFDDVDDYNNYTRTDTTTKVAVFNIACNVVYVDTTNPNQAATVPTWHKKITVRVTSKSMKDTVSLSQIFSYWTFL